MIKRNILIDANNLFHRSYAIHMKDKHPEEILTNHSGYPTGLIYGVFSMLQDWIEEIKDPTRIMFFMDGVPRRRLEINSEYKLKDSSHNRPGKDECKITLSDGFKANNELDVIFHIGSLLGIDLYFDENEEADDLIASFIKSNVDDVNIVISSDKDFFPLLHDNDRVILYRPGIKGNRFFDSEKATMSMKKLYDVDVSPDLVRMFKAFTGDASDNIQGVPRLRKKAIVPFCKFKTVEEVIESGLDGLSKKEKENVINMKDTISKNLQLVSLIDDLDIEKFLKKSNVNFNIAKIILSEDLNIESITTSSFQTYSERKMRISNSIHIPDFLADI